MSKTGKRVTIRIFVPCEAMNVESIQRADGTIDGLKSKLESLVSVTVESFDVRTGRAKE